MTGLTQHVNDLGGLTTIALVPAVMFATMPHSNRARRLLDIAICGLILAGLILSGSVTGFIAAGLGLGVWIVVTRPDRRLVAVIGAMLIAGVGVVVLQLLRHGTSPVARISAVLFGRESVATGAIRVQWDLSVLQVIWAHPFLGVGFDRISEASPTGHFVHNILLAVWLGGGLVALTGFVLMLGAAVRAAVDCVRQSWGEQKVMASALVAAFGASLVVGMAQPSLLSRYAWMPVAMLFVLRQLFLDRGLSEARSTVSTRPLDLSANTLRSN
jgi:O-antigen ligase